MVCRLGDHLDIHTATARPNFLRHLSHRRCRWSVACSPPCAILGGELANGLVNDLVRNGFAEFVPQRLDESDEHAPFDLAALQVRDGNFVGISHVWSPPRWSQSLCMRPKQAEIKPVVLAS